MMRFQKALVLGSTGVFFGLAALALAPVSGRQKPSPPVSFRRQIEPILKARCASCHSKDSMTSGLSVETPAALFSGGTKFGAKIIVPGKPSASRLTAYLDGTLAPRMPMGGAALTKAEIALFSDWISQGAQIDAVKLGWPYVGPKAVSVPVVKNKSAVRNPIDAFVLSKLESRGLSFAPPASKIALVRRVYVDVVGVLPSPTEADVFLRDSSPDAYEKLVDRLLADPRYGERWGRHWLDLVRYADTHGFGRDSERPRAWRYRDFVIHAFNSDLPYSRFLEEQLAGDELFPQNSDALVATGYARLSAWDELSGDDAQRRQDTLNDVTDVTGSVMLGLTVGCARCHNHKYDAITQADYYRLQAFFVGTKWTDAPIDEKENTPSAQKKLGEAHVKIAALKAKTNATPEEKEQTERQIREMEDDIRPVEAVAEAVTDDGPNPPKEHLLLRGNLLTPGPEVAPGFVASLTGKPETPAKIEAPKDGKTTGRRSALARWIGSDSNPMTARVMVNRLWQGHFGRGIVANPSDFGKNGGGATHPELLDYLAVKFMRDGWSLKKINKLMLTSTTYRQSTTATAQAAKRDQANQLFSRMNRIRMDAEALRDSILAVSGTLNGEMGGPGIYPKVSDEVLSTGSTHKWGNSPEDQQNRRTVYVFQRRSLPLPIVEAFDGPDMTNSCPRRSATTIAPQALALFNGEFGRIESKNFAARVVKEAGNDVSKQITKAYQIALCRTPTPAQLTLARQFMARKSSIYQSEKRPDTALADFCHVLMNTNEFLYLD